MIPSPNFGFLDYNAGVGLTSMRKKWKSAMSDQERIRGSFWTTTAAS
jgi:hypothetical protein